MNETRVQTVTEAQEEELSFSAFFEANYEPLFQTIFLAIGDRGEAEDLAQEAMVRAFEHWDRVVAADDAARYVFKIAFNLNRSRLRRLLSSRRRESMEEAPQDPGSISERRSEILRVLSSLPKTQQEALLLVEWLGMSAEEAGAMLGIEAVSVRGRLHRARSALRERFGGSHE
jgi:RNA polymerase sigma-70 factor (ECF subfamily)